MRIFTQSKRCPSQVLFAFDEVVTHKVERMRCAVAYSTRLGCARLVQRLEQRTGATAWQQAPKQFITSLDFGMTEPAALEYLASLPKSEVRVANPSVIERDGLLPQKAYHPKVYLFDEAKRSGCVVGSANLTDSALTGNTEVVVAGFMAGGIVDADATWAELSADTAPLSSELLARYLGVWERPKRREVEPDPIVRPPKIEPQGVEVFWEAISNGLKPSSLDHFWVEAGAMSSGGSHNQLELPRGANRFFGLNHVDYGNEHITIGHPRLTLRESTWSDRPLTWHGNNRMERMNLPTPTQGGFDYRQTAVLFRRHPHGFEIDVLPWNDAGAIAWRAASVELGTVFRLGKGGSRICGLF